MGGALKLLECRVRRERLGDVFRTVHAELVHAEIVPFEAESNGANAVSAAADSRESVRSGVLERGERLVDGKGVREVLGTVCTKLVAVESVDERRIAVSAAADSQIWAVGGILEGMECRIRLEGLGNVAGTLSGKHVAAEAAKEGTAWDRQRLLTDAKLGELCVGGRRT